MVKVVSVLSVALGAVVVHGGSNEMASTLSLISEISASVVAPLSDKAANHAIGSAPRKGMLHGRLLVGSATCTTEQQRAEAENVDSCVGDLNQFPDDDCGLLAYNEKYAQCGKKLNCSGLEEALFQLDSCDLVAVSEMPEVKAKCKTSYPGMSYGAALFCQDCQRRAKAFAICQTLEEAPLKVETLDEICQKGRFVDVTFGCLDKATAYGTNGATCKGTVSTELKNELCVKFGQAFLSDLIATMNQECSGTFDAFQKGVEDICQFSVAGGKNLVSGASALGLPAYSLALSLLAWTLA